MLNRPPIRVSRPVLGLQLYQAACAACHLQSLQGGTAPQLAGTNFRNSWGARPVSQLLLYTRSSMPPGSEGSLTDEEYSAITAYIMSRNGVDPGTTPLSFASEGGTAMAEGATLASGGTTPVPGVAGSVPSPGGRNAVPDYGGRSETATGVTRTFRRVEGFTPVTDAELRNPPDDEWLNPRGNLGAWGYSPLSQINTENVHRLELVWVWGMEDGTRSQPAPLIRDGVMFLPNWGNTTQALDAATGELLWEYRRNFPEGMNRGRGRARTLAIWEDMIYVSTNDAQVIALDARTGVLRWEAKLAEPNLATRTRAARSSSTAR